MPDEIATVKLFNDSTPSVVYITNLAVRYGGCEERVSERLLFVSGANLVTQRFHLSAWQAAAWNGEEAKRCSSSCVLVGVWVSCRRDAFTLDVLEVPQGSGSGFIWDSSGNIVTNFHVIRGASDLRYFPCIVVGTTALVRPLGLLPAVKIHSLHLCFPRPPCHPPSCRAHPGYNFEIRLA